MSERVDELYSKSEIGNFTKIRPVVVTVFHANWGTAGDNEVSSRYSLWERAKRTI